MAKFQESVSRNVSNNRSQISIKSVIAIILFFVFVVLVLLCLAGLKKVEKCFDKQSFYVVYVEKTKRKMAPESVDLIKKLGGAGCLMFFKDEYYLVANVYQKEDDADEQDEKDKARPTASVLLGCLHDICHSQLMSALQTVDAFMLCPVVHKSTFDIFHF